MSTPSPPYDGLFVPAGMRDRSFEELPAGIQRRLLAETGKGQEDDSATP